MDRSPAGQIKLQEAETMLHDHDRQNKTHHQRSRRQLGLEAKHWEQGYMAAMFGIPASDPGLYSAAHQAGHKAAQLGARPVYVNVAGLPALARS